MLHFEDIHWFDLEHEDFDSDGLGLKIPNRRVSIFPLGQNAQGVKCFELEIKLYHKANRKNDSFCLEDNKSPVSYTFNRGIGETSIVITEEGAQALMWLLMSKFLPGFQLQYKVEESNESL